MIAPFFIWAFSFAERVTNGSELSCVVFFLFSKIAHSLIYVSLGTISFVSSAFWRRFIYCKITIFPTLEYTVTRRTPFWRSLPYCPL